MIVTNADAALLISSGSLLLSGLAVGWQIAEWLWSGGRPKAELHHGIAGDYSLRTIQRHRRAIETERAAGE